MAYIPYRRDPSAFRFPLPNRIWKHHLKYPDFSVLAYLHYRHLRELPGKCHPRRVTAGHRKSRHDPKVMPAFAVIQR